MNTISDEVLMRAAKLVGRAMRESLPDPDTCQHEFSPEFQKEIQAMKKRARWKERSAKYLKQASIAAVMALCCTGLFLAVNPEARAAVASWFRSIYENTLVYHFSAEYKEDTLPECDIGYIPEGYEEDRVIETGTEKTILYSNGNDKFLVDWYMLSDNMALQVFSTDVELIPVTVNGHNAEFIVPRDASQTTDLIWTDDGRGIGFTVSSYLAKDEILKIAESITYAD